MQLRDVHAGCWCHDLRHWLVTPSVQEPVMLYPAWPMYTSPKPGRLWSARNRCLIALRKLLALGGGLTRECLCGCPLLGSHFPGSRDAACPFFLHGRVVVACV